MNSKYSHVLACKNLTFYSAIDEESFFAWIPRISCIDAIESELNTLYLCITAPKIHTENLLDLRALFSRYASHDMTQLQRFLLPENEHWLKEDTDIFPIDGEIHE